MKALICVALGLVFGIQVGRTTPQRSPALPVERIEVGGVEIRLGMNKAEIVSQVLRNGYATTGEGRSINIIQKHTDGEAVSLLGLLTFDMHDRLTFVNKSWTPDEETGPAIARGLYGVFSEAQQEGRTVCNVSASSRQSPLADVKAVIFTCGKSQKMIELLLTHYQDYDYAGVSEILKAD